ncbi:PREDICTED: proteasome subunit alpha type-1-like [Amphimedon queenslandica]|uniref:Proteasome subunit alpha type-1 n=1 Tax=Amphimedon queenslandica TaxID=400682 RepID=A0A1X7UPE1_AMPQE|nr:PREDICTED: proteasome subunit alpha type-1-like [Amphimedon queenslandica]|eukprot:XP_003387223.1 PREDICTED: proteasome subunit alpha type-1-like [Amphimedon queenslandica]
MFRNQYDNDVATWSPQGRLHQIEYAMEAVKQGSATVGLKSKTHVILVALKRSTSDLSSYQKKIYPVDDHVGVSIAGLTADGRLLCKFMRTECLNSRYVFNSALPVSRLVSSVGNKMQYCTQFYGRRPYGVGMLIAGYDLQGPHLYQTCPSSDYYDCKCMAIGARSQSARTYLERKLDSFPDASLDELIGHGLLALRECLPSDSELTSKNVSICVVSANKKLDIMDDDRVQPYLDQMDNTKGGRRQDQEEEQRAADDMQTEQEGQPLEPPSDQGRTDEDSMEH